LRDGGVDVKIIQRLNTEKWKELDIPINIRRDLKSKLKEWANTDLFLNLVEKNKPAFFPENPEDFEMKNLQQSNNDSVLEIVEKIAEFIA
jgi:hypothetical protein